LKTALTVFFLIVVQATASGHVMAQSQAIVNALPSAKLVGSATMEYLLWDIYDAELYAPDGMWRKDEPFALSLRYLRSLKGNDIARRSIEEIRGQGFKDETILAGWYDRLEAIFPNVVKNTRLTGVVNRQQQTEFYLDDALIGRIDDPLLSQKFFDIWLSDQTSAPEFRDRLLGEDRQ